MQKIRVLTTNYTNMNHTEEFCDCKGCTKEASYWIEGISGEDTFYLCSDCFNKIVNDEGDYKYIDTDGELITCEIGGYSCDDKCEVCNDVTDEE
jgi:hypothetical protein